MFTTLLIINTDLHNLGHYNSTGRLPVKQSPCDIFLIILLYLAAGMNRIQHLAGSFAAELSRRTRLFIAPNADGPNVSPLILLMPQSDPMDVANLFGVSGFSL